MTDRSLRDADTEGSEPGGHEVTRLDEELIRSLAAVTGDPLVTSLYLDVDGRRYPVAAAYRAEAESLFRTARRRAEGLGPEKRAAVEDDLQDMHAWLATVDRSRTRGMALFACHRQGFLRALTLPVEVRNQVSLGPHPDVAQLSEVLETAQDYLVVLADHRTARLFRARLGQVREEPSVSDPLERQVDTDVELGSWEHRHEEAARRHLRRVARVIGDRIGPSELLVVGGPDRAVEVLVGNLTRAVAGRVAGRVSLPVQAATPAVTRALEIVARHVEQAREMTLVEDLLSRAGSGRGGVAGLAATLEALEQRRVATLVVERGYTAWGARCPVCAHLGVGTRQCPVCGATTEAVEDVVEAAIEEALAQHAAVELCSGAGLDALGHIGAIERY